MIVYHRGAVQMAVSHAEAVRLLFAYRAAAIATREVRLGGVGYHALTWDGREGRTLVRLARARPAQTPS